MLKLILLSIVFLIAFLKALTTFLKLGASSYPAGHSRFGERTECMMRVTVYVIIMMIVLCLSGFLILQVIAGLIGVVWLCMWIDYLRIH